LCINAGISSGTLGDFTADNRISDSRHETLRNLPPVNRLKAARSRMLILTAVFRKRDLPIRIRLKHSGINGASNRRCKALAHRDRLLNIQRDTSSTTYLACSQMLLGMYTFGGFLNESWTFLDNNHELKPVTSRREAVTSSTYRSSFIDLISVMRSRRRFCLARAELALRRKNRNHDVRINIRKNAD
jgi:hypothetical protein